MNREIKFRGKASSGPVKGKWIHGDLCTHSGKVRIMTSILRAVKVDPDTVGQYTGRKDKRGKDIYEGDLLRFYIIRSRHDGFDYVDYIEEHTAVVAFQNTSFDIISLTDRHESDYPVGYLCADDMPCCKDEFEACSNLDKFPDLTADDMWRCEVVGNIYDNTGILEKYTQSN